MTLAGAAPEPSGFYEIQWWRVTYAHGDERKAGPWRSSREEAAEWARRATNVSREMYRTIRYEATVVGAMSADVADVLRRGECADLVGARIRGEA